MFTVRAVQGGTWSFDIDLSGGSFTGSETLAGTITRGDGRTPLLSFTPTWKIPSIGVVTASGSSADLDTLGVGSFFVNVGVGGGPIVSVGILHVGPGSSVTPGLRSLVTPAEAVAVIPDILRTPDQFDALPGLLADATTLIEQECERTLILSDFDGIWPQSSYGRTRTIELEWPIADVTKVQTRAVEAVQLRLTTGERGSIRLVPVSATSRQVASIILSRTVSGVVVANVTLTVSDYATLALLQVALQTTGWTAVVTAGYENYPTSELVNLVAAGSSTTGIGPNQTLGLWLFDGCNTDYEVTPLGKLLIESANVWTEDRIRSVQGRRFGAVRVVYRGGYAIEDADLAAGYAPVPGDLRKATVMTARSLQESALTASPIIQQSAAGKSYSKTGKAGAIPIEAMTILQNHRRVWAVA